MEGELSYDTLRAIVEHASDGIFITDAGFRIEWVNTAAGRLLGRPREELIGHRISDLLDPRELEAAPLRRDELLAGASTITTRTFRMPDGGTRVLEVSAKLIGGGRLLGIARDVTERRETQEKLARSEASFRAVIENIPDAIAVHRDGAIVYANAAAGRMFGSEDLSDLLGRPIAEVVHPDDRPKMAVRLRELQLGAPAVPFMEERLVRRDGSVVLASVGAMRVVFEGKPSIVAIARDITEQRRLNAQLAQADRLASIGTLAAGVAHEINNPLTYVMLHLEAISALAPQLRDAAPRLAEHAAAATEGAQRVARIVRDLRAFSRAEEDARGPIEVHRAVELAISTAAHELKHRARVERVFTEVPRVNASEGRVAQIVLNLLLNAAQAIPEGHPDENRVTVRTATYDGEVHIAVADTGVGIAEEHLAHVFEPFFTTKPVGEGSGLGLSICHGLVAALGGRLLVESAPSVGSTFTIVLPAAIADEPVLSQPQQPARAARARTRILFVDDEAPIGRAVARGIDGKHDIVLATSGAEAVERLERDAEFDVVVCDLVMPGMSGAELYGWIREHRPALAARTLFVSGGRIAESARALQELARFRWLEKPFTLDAFEEAVAEIVRRSET
ncbi:MAG: PAS domain S-box protein [Deltaproteobacteria bacterium]|nr:PAS domain S-box protein [Deltaproteobacteria bacterium]